MSADNGIYILKTRKTCIKNGPFYTNRKGFHYRVAHCQAIDNLDYSDLYMPLYFADSKIYESADEAWAVARKKFQYLNMEFLKLKKIVYFQT